MSSFSFPCNSSSFDILYLIRGSCASSPPNSWSDSDVDGNYVDLINIIRNLNPNFT